MNAGVYPMPVCCGVKIIGNFNRGDEGAELGDVFKRTHNLSGTGYYISTFNDTQEAAYKEMIKYFKVVYQSPPKRNKFSGRQVFIVIFERK